LSLDPPKDGLARLRMTQIAVGELVAIAG